jgi:hypothetical protein
MPVGLWPAATESIRAGLIPSRQRHRLCDSEVSVICRVTLLLIAASLPLTAQRMDGCSVSGQTISISPVSDHALDANGDNQFTAAPPDLA